MSVVAKPAGALYLGSFYTLWVGAALFMPFSVLVLVMWRVWQPVAFLVLYYTFRAMRPRGYWPEFKAETVKRVSGANAQYFRTQKTIVCGDDIKGEKELLCFHPHGILCAGWTLNGCGGKVLEPHGFWYLGTAALFKLPLISDLLSWVGGRVVEKQSFLKFMKEGENIAILPGGFEEATCYQRGKHIVFIKERAGFIKYALQHGYSVRPTYTFGEERTYWTLTWGLKWRLLLNKFKIPGCIFVGKYGLLPDDDVDLVTVIGPPIAFPTILAPSKADIAEWHQTYIKGLQDLFDEHKKEYAAEGAAAKLHLY